MIVVVRLSIVAVVDLSRKLAHKSVQPGDLGLGGRVREQLEQRVQHLPSSRFAYESSIVNVDHLIRTDHRRL
jgi:hypothetical protein